MAEWTSGESGALDGRVGVALDSDQAPPTPWSDDSHIHVSISGEVLSPTAMGLEDDVRLLIGAFVAGGAARWGELTEDLLSRSSGTSGSGERDDDVEIEVHGLSLDPRGEDELRDLIRTLVRERIARGERNP